MSNAESPLIYQAFLLRCWQLSPSEADEPSRWRFVLREIAAEPQEYAFGTFVELSAFLQIDLQQKEDASRGVLPPK